MNAATTWTRRTYSLGARDFEGGRRLMRIGHVHRTLSESVKFIPTQHEQRGLKMERNKAEVARWMKTRLLRGRGGHTHSEREALRAAAA